MSSNLPRVSHGLTIVVILVMVASLLAACGGPEPTPIVIVVTNTFTPEPLVQVVTSTFTPDPGQSSTPVPSTATARPPLEFTTYEHPSAAFRVEVPAGAEIEADESSAFFTYEDSLVMIIFTVPEVPLLGEDLEATIPAIADEALVGEGLISSYSDLEIELNAAGDAAAGRMNISSEQFGEGEGEILLWQVDHVLYMAILLTPDYGQAKAFWVRVMDSLTPATANVPLPEASPAPAAQPTAVLTSPPPAQPSATPRPAATATPRPAPTATTAPPPPPPPTSNQGCYLFENEIPAELTVTFTAQDRQWSDSFKVPASGTKEYCLDPGRYTYTIDAPPPWNSTNGELVVNAGDRFRWPIRAG